MGKHKTEREKLNQKLSKAESVEEKKKIYLEYLQFLKEHEDRWFAKVAQGPFPWYDRNPKGVASLDEKQLRAGKGPYGLQIIPAKKAKYGSDNLYQGMFNRLHAKKSAIEEDQEKYEKLLHDIDHPDDTKSESELTTSSKRRTKAQAKKESEERQKIFQNILRELTDASSRKDNLTKSIDDIASKLGSKTKEKGLDEPHNDDVLEYINDLEKEIDAEEKLIKEKDTRALEKEFSVPSKPAYRNLVVPDKNDRTKKFSAENRHLHNKSNPYGDGEPWNGFVLETRKRLKNIKALRKSLGEMKFDLANRDTETYLDEDADKSFSDIDTNPDVSQLSNLTGEIKDDVGDLRDLEDLHAIKEQIKQSSGRNSPAQSRKNSFHEKLITPEDQEIYEKEKEALNQKAKEISSNINILEKANNKNPQTAIQNKIKLLKDELLDINNKTKELDEKRSFLNKEDDLQQVVEQIKRSSAQNSPAQSRKSSVVEKKYIPQPVKFDVSQKGRHKNARIQLEKKLSEAKTNNEKKDIYSGYLDFLKEHEDRWLEKVSWGPIGMIGKEFGNRIIPNIGPNGLVIPSEGTNTRGIEKKMSRYVPKEYYEKQGRSSFDNKKRENYHGDFYATAFHRLHAKKNAIEEDQEKYEKLLHDIDHPDDAKSESELTTSSKRRTKAQAKKELEDKDKTVKDIVNELVEHSSRKNEFGTAVINAYKALDEKDQKDRIKFINDLEKELNTEENLINTKDVAASTGSFGDLSKLIPDKNNRANVFLELNPHIKNYKEPSHPKDEVIVPAIGQKYADSKKEMSKRWNGFVLETRKRLSDIKKLKKHLNDMKFDVLNADTETYLDEDADKSFSDIDTNPDVSQLSNLTGEIKDDVGDLRDLEDLHAIKEQIKRSSAQVAHPTASRNQAKKEIRALSKSNLKNERRSSAEKNILSAYEQNPSIKKQQQEEKLRNAVSILDKRTLADVSGVPRTTLSLNRGRNTNIRIPIKDVAYGAKKHEGEIPVNEHLKAKEEILGKITENTPPEQKVAVYEEYLDYLLEYGLNKSPELKALLFEEVNAIKQKIQEIEGIHDQDQDQDQAQAEFLAEEEGVPQEIIEQAILNNSQIAPQKMTIRDKQKDLRDQIARINSREDLDNPIRQRSRRQSIQNILQQHPKQERSRSLSQSGIGLNALNKEAEAHDDIDDATDRKKQILEDIYLKNEDLNNKLAKYKHWHNVKKIGKTRATGLAELGATSKLSTKLDNNKSMDDRNKEFQLTQHQQLVEAFRKLMDKDTEINKNQRHANKDPKIIAADKQIFSNLANIGDRKAIFKEQRDKLRGTYNEDTYIKLHKNLNDENVLKNYMDKLIIPAEENRVIKEIKKQNQKALKNAGFNITTTFLKNGMFLGPSKAVLEAIAQEKVERRTNKDIQNYLAKDEVNRMNAALHQIEHDNKKLENMAKHAQSVEAQLSNEKRLNEAADYKDIQNLRAIGESDEAREQRELNLQNQEWYLEQERPKTKLKELAEIIHNKNGVPTYATPQLRMQLEKRDVIPSYNLGSNIVQGAARLMNYGNMDDDYNRQSRRRNASGGHIAQYAHGGSPMGTPDEYKLESYDPRNANTQEDSSFWDRLKANTKWTPENTRKWGAFMAGIDKGHVSIIHKSSSSLNYVRS